MSTDTEFNELVGIVAELKDEVIELREQLGATREQVALLTETMNVLSTGNVLYSVDVPQFIKSKVA